MTGLFGDFYDGMFAIFENQPGQPRLEENLQPLGVEMILIYPQSARDTKNATSYFIVRLKTPKSTHDQTT